MGKERVTRRQKDVARTLREKKKRITPAGKPRIKRIKSEH